MLGYSSLAERRRLLKKDSVKHQFFSRVSLGNSITVNFLVKWHCEGDFFYLKLFLSCMTFSCECLLPVIMIYLLFQYLINPPPLVSSSGLRLWVHLVRRPLFNLLYQPQMIDDDECGAVGGMIIGRGNRSTRRKPAPVPLCPPQIPHDLTWARTRAVAVGSQRLTAWAMARPIKT
jgi:hypothetical protein